MSHFKFRHKLMKTNSASSVDSQYKVVYYMRKNAQVDAILMKTGLNNVLLPTLFIAVNNIEQYCYTRFRLNNIVQYCWQVWTTWAEKHCSVLSQNRVHRRPTSWFFLWFSYDFGVTRNSSSNADAMVLASARLRGIHPPDNIQNGGCPGGWNASQTRTG
jgi:hypothetical protein